MSYCDTCCHQYSDICGTCETLDGVPIKYSEKKIDKAAEAVIEKIARKLSNDILFGMNRKETNADRIRCMSDEELAEWLETKVWDLPWCNDDTPVDDETKICSKWDCVKCALEWLKQEVSDDS